MSSRLSAPSASQSSAPSGAMTSSDRARAIEAMKSMYKAAQHAEYLHLQAEAEILLQQLQTLQQRRVPVSAGIGSVSVTAQLR